jgi:NTE family protein
MTLKCDAVFEGGGVKGIALVGAVAAIQKAGYEFENLAGTSAGAIVASLLAAGYSADEIENELQTVNYNDFKDENFLDKFGLPGVVLSAALEYGVYKGDFFENWLGTLLQAKGKTTFGDIKMANPPQEKYKYKFQAIACDITEKRLLVLPGDLKLYGYDPDLFGIARAVRMSMSIPMFFEPVKLTDGGGRDHLIVDGGVLSNYPVWLLDDGTSDPEWPTFGFKLTDSDTRSLNQPVHSPIRNFPNYLVALVSSMIEAHDNYHISISRGDYDRTIAISTTVEIEGGKKKIGTTDFNITRAESRALYDNGLNSAEVFLDNWDFEAWKKKYRQD